jgi:hypothetical protein
MDDPVLPTHSELLIRGAWLINYLTGQISNIAARTAMMTTAPKPDPNLQAGFLEMDFVILESLRELIGQMKMDLDPQIHDTFLATTDMMRLHVAMIQKTNTALHQMQFMTEPELQAHLNKQLRYIKACQTSDTLGSMLVIFQEDGITQYGATINPESSPAALRELADRIERRETVKR